MGSPSPIAVDVLGGSPEEAALHYLVRLPGAFSPHSGVTLFEHLLGTYCVLNRWDAPLPVRLAGLFHSIYGSPAHPSMLLRKEDRRPELREIIGVEAEDLVFRFSSLDLVRLLTSTPGLASHLPRALAQMAAANVVEQWSRVERRGRIDPTLSSMLLSFVAEVVDGVGGSGTRSDGRRLAGSTAP